MVDKEFANELNKLTLNGFGLVFIGHERVRIDTDGQTSAKHISPDINDRCSKIINRMVDLTAYIGIENKVRYIYPRQIQFNEGSQITEIYAGSHFANLNDKIELGYEPLVNAIADAMTTGVNGKEIKLVDAPVAVVKEEKIDFKATKTAIGKIAKALSVLDDSLEEPHYMSDYKNITEEILGRGKLVKDTDEAQAEHLSLILEELQNYVKKNNLSI